MTLDEAKRLLDEINRTPDWEALKVYELRDLRPGAMEYGVRAWHTPSGRIEPIVERGRWEDLTREPGPPRTP